MKLKAVLLAMPGAGSLFATRASSPAPFIWCGRQVQGEELRGSGRVLNS